MLFSSKKALLLNDDLVFFVLAWCTKNLATLATLIRKLQTPTGRVVDLFGLVSHLLGVQVPADVDADFTRISHLLRSPDQSTEINTALVPIVHLQISP
jgi:hypothetical protein